MHRSVINNTDLFAPCAAPARETSRPTASAGITISVTVFPSLPIPSLPSCLRPSRPLPSLLRAKKRKTNSFPYKWSESLQPRDPLELQIFHLCPGAPRYYYSAIIPPLSFSPLLPLPFFYLLSCASHLRRPPPPSPVPIHLPIGEKLAQLPSVGSRHSRAAADRALSKSFRSMSCIHGAKSQES